MPYLEIYSKEYESDREARTRIRVKVIGPPEQLGVVLIIEKPDSEAGQVARMPLELTEELITALQFAVYEARLQEQTTKE